MKFHVWIAIKNVGESCRSLNEWIYEHRIDLKRVAINNGLVNHNLETNPRFNLKEYKIIVYIVNKKDPENGWI